MVPIIGGREGGKGGDPPLRSIPYLVMYELFWRLMYCTPPPWRPKFDFCSPTWDTRYEHSSFALSRVLIAPEPLLPGNQLHHVSVCCRAASRKCPMAPGKEDEHKSRPWFVFQSGQASIVCMHLLLEHSKYQTRMPFLLLLLLPLHALQQPSNQQGEDGLLLFHERQ